MNFIPPLPAGYIFSLAKRKNLLLGYHPTLPVLYLDEHTMQWRELDRHTSELGPRS
jgi:hypothetical protein